MKQFSVLEGLLFYTPQQGNNPVTRLCVPVSDKIRLTILYEAHDAYLHQGIDKTYRRLHAGYYYWPTMTGDVQRYINSCGSCQRMKSQTRAEAGAISGHQVPDQRWEVLHMDFITDLQPTAEGFDSILVCTDRLSRYSYLIPTKKSDTSLITARRLFQVVFTVHGPPKRLITDRDTRWVSEFYSELMRIMDVTQSMGTSHYHDFNGLSENVNRTVEVMLRHVLTDHPGRDFTDVIPMCQYAYNTAHHSAIGTSPYFASWGFEPRNPTMFRVTMDPTGHPAVEEFVDHSSTSGDNSGTGCFVSGSADYGGI